MCSILALSFLVCCQLPALAKAYHPTMKEIIQTAEVIAVVKVDSCDSKLTKSSSFDYREESTATIKTLLKGTAPKKISILGAEVFKCANCHFPAGESLVFLRKSGDSYVGVGWHNANLPITNGKVAWFQNLDERRSDIQTDLKSAIDQIKTVMTNSSNPTAKPAN